MLHAGRDVVEIAGAHLDPVVAGPRQAAAGDDEIDLLAVPVGVFLVDRPRHEPGPEQGGPVADTPADGQPEIADHPAVPFVHVLRLDVVQMNHQPVRERVGGGGPLVRRRPAMDLETGILQGRATDEEPDDQRVLGFGGVDEGALDTGRHHPAGAGPHFHPFAVLAREAGPGQVNGDFVAVPVEMPAEAGARREHGVKRGRRTAVPPGDGQLEIEFRADAERLHIGGVDQGILGHRFPPAGRDGRRLRPARKSKRWFFRSI